MGNGTAVANQVKWSLAGSCVNASFYQHTHICFVTCVFQTIFFLVLFLFLYRSPSSHMLFSVLVACPSVCVYVFFNHTYELYDFQAFLLIYFFHGYCSQYPFAENRDKPIISFGLCYTIPPILFKNIHDTARQRAFLFSFKTYSSCVFVSFLIFEKLLAGLGLSACCRKNQRQTNAPVEIRQIDKSGRIQSGIIMFMLQLPIDNRRYLASKTMFNVHFVHLWSLT